ncbi:hypothetical protein Tcan_17729 [Toxocara canis]|uniref:Uncharacterized protein n=1 Tax=Toxocara canis TaxID=6265 RepID=A0A0B2VRE2_TOXCA|nr:hypothetical protein Tcan_17729 [Toxocara canis]
MLLTTSGHTVIATLAFIFALYVFGISLTQIGSEPFKWYTLNVIFVCILSEGSRIFLYLAITFGFRNTSFLTVMVTYFSVLLNAVHCVLSVLTFIELGCWQNEKLFSMQRILTKRKITSYVFAQVFCQVVSLVFIISALTYKNFGMAFFSYQLFSYSTVMLYQLLVLTFSVATVQNIFRKTWPYCTTQHKRLTAFIFYTAPSILLYFPIFVTEMSNVVRMVIPALKLTSFEKYMAEVALQIDAFTTIILCSCTIGAFPSYRHVTMWLLCRRRNKKVSPSLAQYIDRNARTSIVAKTWHK